MWCNFSWFNMILLWLVPTIYEATGSTLLETCCIYCNPNCDTSEMQEGLIPGQTILYQFKNWTTTYALRNIIHASFFIKSMHTHFSFPLSKKDSGALGCFSKLFRAWTAILETMIRLPWKAALLICFRYEERQNNCQVSKLETSSYWRKKGIMAPVKFRAVRETGL